MYSNEMLRDVKKGDLIVCYTKQEYEWLCYEGFNLFWGDNSLPELYEKLESNDYKFSEWTFSNYYSDYNITPFVKNAVILKLSTNRGEGSANERLINENVLGGDKSKVANFSYIELSMLQDIAGYYDMNVLWLWGDESKGTKGYLSKGSKVYFPLISPMNENGRNCLTIEEFGKLLDESGFTVGEELSDDNDDD